MYADIQLTLAIVMLRKLRLHTKTKMIGFLSTNQLSVHKEHALVARNHPILVKSAAPFSNAVAHFLRIARSNITCVMAIHWRQQ